MPTNVSANQIISLITRTARPIDKDDQAASRSKERYKRAFLTSGTSAASKLVSTGANLIAVPLTLNYLGAERYGVWITISSLIAFFGFSDLGLNNGLLNGIAKAHGKNDRPLARAYVSSAFFLLTAIALGLGIAFAIAYPWIPWSSVLHISVANANQEAGPAVAVFVGCFLLGIPINIVTRIQAGYQEGFASNIWSTLGSVLSLVSLLLVIRLKGSLPLLVLALAGTPLLATCINGITLLTLQRPWLRPALSAVRRGASSELLKSGFLFFILQLAMAVGYSSDNLVIAHVIGPGAVTQYSVPAKLFGIINMLTSLLVLPFWPAYAEALTHKDNDWIIRAVRRSLCMTVACAMAGSSILLLFGRPIMQQWVGNAIPYSVQLALALAAWSIVNALSVPVAMLLNAANVIKFQVIVATGASLINIALSVYLTKIVGITGVILGSIISQIFAVLIPYVVYLRRFNRSIEPSLQEARIAGQS